ncbi:MAG: MBL fold metallo-hydrolase [Anaerolineales bacterium]|nr:MBL fold metallo-hydrolase [Anaerolineales bacterium]
MDDVEGVDKAAGIGLSVGGGLRDWIESGTGSFLEKTTLFLLIWVGLLLAGCTGAGTGAAPSDLPLATAPAVASLTPFQPVTPTASPDPGAALSPTPIPIPTPTHPTPTPCLTATEVDMSTETFPDPLIISIVYNNLASDARLVTDWGFSAHIQYHGHVILFDTGTNGQTLLQNMQVLGIAPAAVQTVVLSHAHRDHTGGLDAFLAAGSQPTVYLLASFGDPFHAQVSSLTEVIDGSPGLEIAEDILTTGELTSGIPEQALVIRTPQGLVVVTGCAHPGIVRIIERAVALTGEPVELVMGGFHLRDSNQAEIARIVSDFRRLGVRRVAPSHCTGDLAIRLFAEAYGDDFIASGAGSVITIGE